MTDLILAFRASGGEWAVPIRDVHEIIESPRMTRLPLLPDSAPAIIAVRGDAVPAVDVAKLAGRAEVKPRSAILVGRGTRRVALLADEVTDIVEPGNSEATVIDLAELFARLEGDAQ